MYMFQLLCLRNRNFIANGSLVFNIHIHIIYITLVSAPYWGCFLVRRVREVCVRARVHFTSALSLVVLYFAIIAF